MPNIATVMREEITRLSRRASRKDLGAVKRATAQQRRHIAELRRQIAKLTQLYSTLSRSTRAAAASAASTQDGSPRLRFVAKGLRSHRGRLGLSAAEFAALVGVSSQTIYNWEHGVTRPGGAQLSALANLRNMGKKDAAARLQQLEVDKAAKRAAASAKRSKKAVKRSGKRRKSK